MKWAILHDRTGAMMSACNAQLIVTDPVRIREVNGVALLDTRTTARKVINTFERQGVDMSGYRPVKAAVRVDVANDDATERPSSEFIPFSVRLRISEVVDAWYARNPTAKRCTLNTVTAIYSAGLLKRQRVEVVR